MSGKEDKKARAWLRDVATAWEKAGQSRPELPSPPRGLPEIKALVLRPWLEMSDIQRGSMTDTYTLPDLSEPIVMHPIAFEVCVTFADGTEFAEPTSWLPVTAGASPERA